MTVSPPCDIPPVHQNLPQNLTPLYGKPTTNRRTDKYKKIVLYILAADDGKPCSAGYSVARFFKRMGDSLQP